MACLEASARTPRSIPWWAATRGYSGDIEFRGGFHVDGYIKGNILAEHDTESVLSISESGTVEGSVSVPHVVLNGTVKGDVSARERVQLGTTAA